MDDAAFLVQWLILIIASSIALIVIGIAGQVARGLLFGRLSPLDLIMENGRWSGSKSFNIACKSVLLYAMAKDASDGNPNWQLQVMLATTVMAHHVIITYFPMLFGRSGGGASDKTEDADETPKRRGGGVPKKEGTKK